MKQIFEFTWNINYIFLLLQSLLMSFRMEINFSRSEEKDNNKYQNKKIMFDLITECCLSLCTIFYLIGRKINKSKRIKTIFNNENLNNTFNRYNKNKKIKKYKNNLYTYGLILFTSFNKFMFSIFNYYISLKYYQNNYLITTTVFFNLIFILDVILLAIIRTKILKRTFFFHNFIAIILLFILMIPISIIYSRLYTIEGFKYGVKYLIVKSLFSIITYHNFKYVVKYLIYFVSFFFILFLIMINFVIYRVLIYENFLNIYLINSIEGFLIAIYTIIFYYLLIKNNNREKFGEPFNFSYVRLFFSCIFQIIINILIKFIIFKFNEMYETIPYIIQMVIDVIKNCILEKYFEKNFLLSLILLLLNIFLVLDILFFTETIIIKVCGLEKKTQKYLEIEEEKENIGNIFPLENVK